MLQRTAAAVAAVALCAAPVLAQAPGAQRPMTFLDMREFRSAGSPAPSPDGRWMLYTINTPDWMEAKSQSDVYVVSMQQGLSSTKQLTFTAEKNEASPKWARDGSFFVFASNRDAPTAAAGQSQLYLMRPDGGEARRITNAKDGVLTPSRVAVWPD
jgi:Tol biopolymer transport system component